MVDLRPPERRATHSGTEAFGAALRLAPGFTLLEIIAVLVMISLLAIITLTSIDTSVSNLRAATESLRSNLRYAQIMAMKDSSPWTITFTASGYSLGAGSLGGGFPNGAGASVILPSGVSITAGMNNTISFDSRGIPTIGGAALPGGGHTVTLSTANTSLDVVIQPLTGFMEVS